LKNIQRFCADAGYRKTFEQDISRGLGLGVDISARIKPEWEVFSKCWIVERSLAWFNNSKRLSKDAWNCLFVPLRQCALFFHSLLKTF